MGESASCVRSWAETGAFVFGAGGMGVVISTAHNLQDTDNKHTQNSCKNSSINLNN